MINKIVGMFVCVLMIATVFPVVSAMNAQSPDTLASSFIGIKIVAKVYSIDDPDNLLEGVVEMNDTVTGKYVYDTGIPDTNPNPSHGNYQFTSSTCKFEVKAGGLDFKTNPSDVHLAIDTYNDYITTWDEISVLSTSNLQLSNGMLVNIIQWDLVDANGTVLESDALPTTAPVLEDWPTNNQLILLGEDPSNPTKTYAIYAHVTSATKNTVVDSQEAKNTVTPVVSPLPYSSSPSFMLFWIHVLERFPFAFPLLRHFLGC